jgi:hypothetical protein
MAASTPELIARIDELMQQSSEVIDIFDIFNHVLLDTTEGRNLSTTEVLAWIPAHFLPEIVQWLEEQVNEQAEDDEEVIDPEEEC